MRRVVSPLRGEARPRKRFCPPRTRSPHLNLSQPSFEAWCADPIHPHFHSCWQLGDAFVFPPLQPVHSPPASRMLGDTAVSLLQCTEPVPATRQPSTSLSAIPSKDAEGSPSRWRVPLLPGLLDTQISGMSSLARHSDPSVTLPSRMGAFTRGIAVGSPHNPNRLYSSVWEKSPPFRWASPDSSKQRLQGFCSTTRTFLPPAERSNRGSTAVGSRTRFIQPLLPRSKEGRRLEAYSGSTAFESFPLQREVQDADDEDYHVSGPGGRLVCHHRPEGCVFSHPGRSKTQEIPSVRLWREGLPIQGPALQPGFGPEDIYQMHGCCTGPFEASVQMQARLAPARIPVFTACLARFKLGHHVSVGTCRRLLGLMAAASPVLPLGLLHMRPFLWWMKELRLHPTVPATRLIRVSRSCCRHLLMWRDPVFLQSGVRMGAIHRRHMITTDASMTGWGAVLEGRPASGEWKEEFLFWHINCLELRAVFLALKYFLPVLGGHHIIVRTDNMAVVSHINRQGGSKSRTLDRLAHHLLLWSQDKFLSLRAVHVPGVLNLAGRFSVETEAQAGGMDVEPSDGIPDLGSV